MHTNSVVGAGRGFTLIELLIVVAIIAILAAIAVPNFLEAQTRAKVSRVKSDQRTLATAMETYRVDNNAYSPVFNTASATFPWPGLEGPRIENRGDRFHWLTSPIAYITSVLFDPFTVTPADADPTLRLLIIWGEPAFSIPSIRGRTQEQLFPQQEWRSMRPLWTVLSAGPDRDYDILDSNWQTVGVEDYDPTNGTVSDGDVVRPRQ